MEVVFTIAGIGLLVAAVQTILKQIGKEDYGFFVVVAGTVAIFLLVLQRILELLERMRQTFNLW